MGFIFENKLTFELRFIYWRSKGNVWIFFL